MECLVIGIVALLLHHFNVVPTNVTMTILIGGIVWTYVAAGLYFICGFMKFYYHGLLGWHRPDDSPIWNDGCSNHCKCKYCGKNIMLDSQGNWFTFD